MVSSSVVCCLALCSVVAAKNMKQIQLRTAAVDEVSGYDLILLGTDDILVSDTAPGEPEDRTRNLAYFVLGLLALSLVAGSYIYRERIVQAPRSALLANGSVLLYSVLTITADILVQILHQNGGERGYKFHPAALVFFVEFGKLVFNAMAAAVDYKNTQLCSVSDFVTTMKLMTMPAACFVSLNIIRYYALASANLSEYRVFRSFDVVIVAILWCVAFKRSLKVTQLAGVGLVTLSCVSLAWGNAAIANQGVRLSQTALVLSMAFISSLGMVTNEMGLKALPHLSLFTQNCALYVVSCTLNFIGLLAVIRMDTIFDGIDRTAITLMCVDIGLGMCVACVLKYADAIIKQLATGWITPLEPLIGHFFVGTSLTPISVACTLLAGFGNVIYRMEPPAKFAAGASKDAVK